MEVPERKKSIGCRWVYEFKINESVPFVDYRATFAPVAGSVTVRFVTVYSALQGWHFRASTRRSPSYLSLKFAWRLFHITMPSLFEPCITSRVQNCIDFTMEALVMDNFHHTCCIFLQFLLFYTVFTLDVPSSTVFPPVSQPRKCDAHYWDAENFSSTLAKLKNPAHIPFTISTIRMSFLLTPRYC